MSQANLNVSVFDDIEKEEKHFSIFHCPFQFHNWNK